MPFDARRWPNAVTIGRLIAERMGMDVHCNKCASNVGMDPAALSFAPETPIPARAGRSSARAVDQGRARRGQNGQVGASRPFRA